MKYIEEFRSEKLCHKMAEKIRRLALPEKINLMEVCGTHTQNFFRFGLDKLLPQNIRLISGPGCPVCVSSQEYIDRAIAFAADKNKIMITFGDMLRVPGTISSLERARAEGADIRIAYSPLDALAVCRKQPDKKIIFLGVGFETTAPAIALSVVAAQKEKLDNFFVFLALKLIPPALALLLKDKRLNIDGFLCPGHVSAIIGSRPYQFVPEKYRVPCCIAGFEPLDILEGVYLLARQITANKPGVANQYARVVPAQGNPQAKKIIARVFSINDADWRGLGRIPDSGLSLRREYFAFDAAKRFKIKLTAYSLKLKAKCHCADVLKGLIRPSACPLFRKKCTPDKPLGPCMVSNEGACNAYYKYRR